MSKTETKLEAVKNGEVKETELTVSPMTAGAAQMASIREKAGRLAEMNAGVPLSGKYREFEEGESIRGVFLGFKHIYKDDTPLAAAWWVESDMNMYLNAGASLVKQLTENNIGQGTPVQITYTGEEKTASGHKVKIYDIRVLQDVSEVETETE